MISTINSYIIIQEYLKKGFKFRIYLHLQCGHKDTYNAYTWKNYSHHQTPGLELGIHYVYIPSHVPTEQIVSYVASI